KRADVSFLHCWVLGDFMRPRLLLLIWLIITFPVCRASAASFFVRSTSACANSGNGSSTACAVSPGGAGAWRGLANIAWPSVAAGDTVFLVGGDTYTDAIRVAQSGVGTGATFISPITISVTGTNSGTNPAIIDASGLPGIPIDINGSGYIIIDGLFGQAAVSDASHGTPNL